MFLSQSLSVLSFLTSSTLSSLLDYSFAPSASQLPSERPSLALHSSTITSLLEWCRCTLQLLHTIDSQLTEQTSDTAGSVLSGSSVVEEPIQLQPPQHSFEYVAQLATCSLSSCGGLVMLVQHMLRVLMSSAEPASITSFLATAVSESVKAIDAKLAVERCRVAALATISSIIRLGKRQAHTEQTGGADTDGKDGEEFSQESDVQTEQSSSGSSLPAADLPVTTHLLSVLSSIKRELRAGSRSGRVRDDSDETSRGRPDTAVRKRRRGGAVLRSRNRVVDALLQEEGERGDSYMDLDGFLVADDEDID